MNKKEQYENDPKHCPHCEEKIPFSKRVNKFCNSSCSASFNNKGFDRHNNLRNKIRTCVNCEKSLLGQNHGRKYCSHKCQWEFLWLEKKQQYLQMIKEGKPLSGTQVRNLVTRSREHRCEVCQNTEWQSEEIPLEVDHIDGNSKNNQLDNLRLICPNCHAQTSTYKARNRGNGRAKRRQRYKERKSF